MNQEDQAKSTEKDEEYDPFEEAKKLRPDLPLRLETALRMGRKARHHLLLAILHMQEGATFDGIPHLEEALLRLNDQNYEVANVMSLIECFYIQNFEGSDTPESLGCIGIPLKKK